MDAGKHYIVKMRDGTVTAIEKTGLPEKIRVCLGNGCFIAGTLVTTRSGLKPIEEIKIGDYVLSRNEETGEDSYKKVTDILVRSTQEICTIELETGKIKSTTGHLFMVKDKWWKAAVELGAGDILVTSDGKEQVVKSIKVEEKGYPVTTYNLTVEDNHTFFVNDAGILTHNMNNVLKGCNFATEASEKLSKEISKTSPAELAQSWQGSFPYVGIDKYKNITFKKGKVIYVGDPYPTGYATTKSALDRINGDARKLFEGLQVKPYWEDGMNFAEYRSKMMAYEIIEPIDAAFGITKANHQFGSGGLPQMFIPNFKELLSNGKIKKVELKAVKLSNYKMELDDYYKILDALEGLK